MLLGRIDRRELPARRIAAALARRLQDLPQRAAWRAPTGRASRNRARLEAYRNRHRGQRCFLIGNGPSLAGMQLAPLAGELTLGTNRIYLMFDRLPFRPSYYCAVNELVLDQFAGDIAALSMPKFLNWSRRGRFPDADDTLFVKDALAMRDFFRAEPGQPLCTGGTVTYAALQLLYFMGFETVVLIGVDHEYAERGTPNAVELRSQAVDRSHCHPEYFARGTRWQLPDLIRSERAYALARAAYERDGRRILDATAGGKLEIFERVEFTSLFSEAA